MKKSLTLNASFTLSSSIIHVIDAKSGGHECGATVTIDVFVIGNGYRKILKNNAISSSSFPSKA